ncbi:MAG: hypothetical protein K0R60_946 [Microbacterium sp.]|jgi:hypothetical protein|nr:hypothetical protein [Microbacterium sp.]
MTAALALAAVLALAGCTGPDPAIIADEAEAAFDALVERAAGEDAAVLRTLEESPPAEQDCAGDEERTQTSFTATGTLSITADEAETRRILEDLGDSLDPEEWTAIRPAVPEQLAWSSEHDVVIALTADGPSLVIAVFTPCATA